MRLDLSSTQELGVDQAGDSEQVVICLLSRPSYSAWGVLIMPSEVGACRRFCGVVALRSHVNKPYYAGANQELFVLQARASLNLNQS